MPHHSITRPVHTYSIVARDPQTGQLGVAVQSHAFGVGSLVPWAEAGVGAVATQSFVRIDYGPEGLALLREGKSAGEALKALLAQDPEREVRQVAVLDAAGNVAVHTGARCIAAAGHLTGPGFSVQANLMMDDTIWPAMAAAYTGATGDLAERLLAALDAAQAAGGDIRGQQSAALLVVSGERTKEPWQGRIYDLRVEDAPRPLEELRRLVRLRRASLASDEAEAASVAGDYEAAAAAFKRATELAPDDVEMRFWAAATLFSAGQEDAALGLFAHVFAKEPIWIELVPRVARAGLLPDDPDTLRRISGVLTT